MKSTITSKIIYKIEMTEPEAEWLKRQLTRLLPPNEDETDQDREYRKMFLNALTIQPCGEYVAAPVPTNKESFGESVPVTPPNIQTPIPEEMTFGNTVFNAKWHKN